MILKSDRPAIIALSLSAVAVILSIAALSVALLAGGNTPADEASDSRMRSFLLEKPEVLVEALQSFEEKRQAEAENEITAAIVAKSEEILRSASSPVLGNPEGDVSVVEFFDYNCPYCHKADPILASAIKGDPQLRIVMKEFPVLGPDSSFAARAALAAAQQGKYEALHKAMMAYEGAVNEGVVRSLAESAGVDIGRMEAVMDTPVVAEEIERNLKLAGELGISGTPSFIVGSNIARGLVDLKTLQDMIAAARAAQGG